jgi:hypothetical protein
MKTPKTPISEVGQELYPATESRVRRFHDREKQQIIVLVDGAGNYYELPRATLERSRVKEHRKKEVAAAVENVPTQFGYIRKSTIPGSMAADPFKGGRQLHYAGFYLSATKSKR